MTVKSLRWDRWNDIETRTFVYMTDSINDVTSGALKHAIRSFGHFLFGMPKEAVTNKFIPYPCTSVDLSVNEARISEDTLASTNRALASENVS